MTRMIIVFLGAVMAFGLAALPEATFAQSIDVEAATRAYLDSVPAEARERSDAYFEGGYWLTLWGLLYGLISAWVFLHFRISSRIRDLANRWSKRVFPRPAIYAVLYTPLAAVVAFPLTLYQGFFREHQYELATQTFGPWMNDQLMGLLVGTIGAAIFLPVLYAVIRRTKGKWWMWGGGVVTVFLFISLMISPVFIQPLFNSYTPLEDGPLKSDLVSMAKSAGVPADDIFVVDASQQTTRISANVSGFGPTTRIALNDNLLNNTSEAEIKAVMGHEIAHYVLDHGTSNLIRIGLLLTFGLAFVAWGYPRLQARYGEAWGIGDISDPAGYPLVGALLGVYMFAASPVLNQIIYMNEVQADNYGLQLAEEPEGFAEIALKLGAYRKLEPGALEEFLFFDHPSGYNRIKMAMTWRAENPLPAAEGTLEQAEDD